jgi:hypothetical protein
MGHRDRHELAAPVRAGKHVNIPGIVADRRGILAEPVSVSYFDGTILSYLNVSVGA